MSLSNRPYKIISKVDSKPVGRLLHEDRSLLPKKIVVLSEDAPAAVSHENRDSDSSLSDNSAALSGSSKSRVTTPMSSALTETLLPTSRVNS